MCSVALLADPDLAILVGRNIDWIQEPPSDVWVFPRGMTRDGRVQENAAQWQSKYASVSVVGYQSLVSGGMNDAGLAANCLWLSTGDHGSRDTSRIGLSESIWAQFYLDNFATVGEAVDATRSSHFQIRGCDIGGYISHQHLAIQDATGDAAIIEYVNGQTCIYHDRRFVVATNDPTYDLQIQHLKQYQGFGGEKPLPGTSEAADRFVRGVYYLTRLPKATSHREAVAGLMSVMRSMAQPPGVVDPARPNISATIATTIADLTYLTFYGQWMKSPYPIWIEVPKLSELNTSMRLADVHAVDRIGNVTDQLQPATPFAFAPAAD